MNALQNFVEAAHIVDVEIALRSMLIGRIDIRDGRVAVPFEVDDVGIIGHQLVDDAENILLYLGVGEVEDELVAVVVRLAVGLFDDPVVVLLIQFALRVDHLRLYPQTELHASFFGSLCQRRNASGQFAVGRLPVAKAGVIVLSRVFIAEPSVVEQKHIHAEVFGILHQLGKRFLIEVEAGVLPVVEQCHA